MSTEPWEQPDVSPCTHSDAQIVDQQSAIISRAFLTYTSHHLCPAIPIDCFYILCIFQLLCLATMFQKETRMQPYTSLSPMGERYALVLQRRLINELGSETGKMYYQSFVQGLDIVREFAALLRRVMGPMMDPANIRMMQQLQQQQLLQQQR